MKLFQSLKLLNSLEEHYKRRKNMTNSICMMMFNYLENLKIIIKILKM